MGRDRLAVGMSNRGFICVARGLLDHPIVGVRSNTPYSRTEAWQWLLLEAAYKPRRYQAGAVLVDLQRGQLAHSTRYMARAWTWSEAAVRRFLSRLKTGAGTGAMIDASTDAGVTVITICNYESYQSRKEKDDAPSDATSDAQTDAKVTQQRRRKEQGNKETKEEVRPPADADGPLFSPEDTFWKLEPAFSEVGIVRSRMGQLAKACNGDFVAAIRIAADVMKAKAPNPYLSAIIKNMSDDVVPPRAAFDPSLPGFVSAAKAEGIPVEKHKNGWRIGGEIFDDKGEQIGW